MLYMHYKVKFMDGYFRTIIHLIILRSGTREKVMLVPDCIITILDNHAQF